MAHVRFPPIADIAEEWDAAGMKPLVAYIAAAYWLFIAVPFWWLSVAFGAPLPPRPSPDADDLEVFFLASFYVPLLVLMTTGLLALLQRQRRRH